MRLSCAGLAFVMLMAIAASADAKSYSARRFESDIRVREGGTLEVTETVVFSFENGTFDHVFREITTRKTDGITFVAAAMDGRNFSIGRDVDQVEVTGRSRVRVTWRFEPVSTSTHTFTLTYLARGVVQQTPSGDLLEWRALPTEHAYRIDDALVTLRVPSSVAEGLDDASLRPRVDAHRADSSRIDWGRNPGSGDLIVQATGSQLRANGWLEASATFPRGSLISAPPEWQAQRLFANSQAPRWITAALAVGLAGLMLLFAMRQQYDAPPRDLMPATPAAAAPDNLAPHLAGALASNGRSSLEHAMAALFGLADRGELTIVEEHRGLFGQRNFSMRRTPTGKPLTPAETALLNATFDGAGSHGVSLMTARRRIGRRLGPFRTGVQQELLAAGLLDEDRNRVRQRYNNLSIALIILSSVALVAAGLLVETFGPWPLLVPGAVMFVGLVSLIAGAASTPLTNEGLRRAAAWRSFGRHLKSVAGDRDRLTVESATRVLPFAVALGLAGAWSKYMRRHPSGLPSWFQALSTVRDDDAFPAFIAAGGAHGGHGAAGGGGGAAGGGASGAG
jgi:predicted membrane protein DUF2207